VLKEIQPFQADIARALRRESPKTGSGSRTVAKNTLAMTRLDFMSSSLVNRAG